MKFIFNGLSYFGKKLVADLNEFAPQHSFSFFDTYTSKLEQIKFATALPFSHLVISMNGVLDKSGSLDLVLKLKKKLLMQWQGTDTLTALEKSKNKKLNRKYIDYATHITDAPWMKEELSAIGIERDLIFYKWIAEQNTSEKFKELGAYSYLPEEKENLYGWKNIYEIAKKHSDIYFHIAGTTGKKLEQLPNIKFLGWVDEQKMKELREQLPIFLRMPEHDGYSLSVLEALSCGNEVMWTMPHEQCRLANKNNAEDVFNTIINDIKEKGLKRNESNIGFIRNAFSKEKVLSAFVEKLEEESGR